MVQLTKKCYTCGRTRSINEFYVNHNKIDNLNYECKDCYRLRYGQKKREKVEYLPEKKQCTKCGKIKSQIEFTFCNKSGSSPDGLSYCCRDCARENQLKKNFDITQADYNSILEQQNGVCAICHQPETTKLNGEIKALSVDHCHKTGKIRGLLCSNCNHGLGCFKDNPETLESATNYIKETR